MIGNESVLFLWRKVLDIYATIFLLAIVRQSNPLLISLNLKIHKLLLIVNLLSDLETELKQIS